MAATTSKPEAMTNAELMEKYGDTINATVGGLKHNTATGYYADTAEEGGEYNLGEEGYVPGMGYQVKGPSREDHSADATFLSDGAYAVIKQLQQQWTEASERGDQEAMDALHAEAERIRARQGYSGGEDGTKYLVYADEDSTGGRSSGGGVSGGSASAASLTLSAPSIQVTGRYSADTAGLKELLSQWQTAAVQQQNASIDYGVQQAVEQLQRALEDAQPKFTAQQEAIALDERQGLDNSALYAELRGDKGGIGQSQYNAIQAAAAKNRLAVQQAQTKLATDTARQIGDLRAQGEFQKADAALQISQQYLQKLASLEQWAQEFDLSAAQFETGLQKWQAEYELDAQKLAADVEQSQASTRLAEQKLQYQAWQDRLEAEQAAQKAQAQSALELAQLTGTTADGALTVSAKNQLISMGKALLDAGIVPGASQLDAMGMTEEQARQYVLTVQLKNAAKG